MITGTEDDDDEPQVPPLDEGWSDVSAHFVHIWTRGAGDPEIYAFLALTVAPRINSHLKTYTSLQEADREDCISIAFERFAPAVAARATVHNPYGYVFAIAVNEARKLLRARKAEGIDSSVDVDSAAPDEADPFQRLDQAIEPDDPSGPIALAIIDDAVPEVRAEEFWAVEVVRAAVSRLPAGARRLVEFLQYRDFAFVQGEGGDFDYLSTDAAGDLGLSSEAFRTAKHRAYARLRQEIPRAIVEMGLSPPERAETLLFPDGREGPDGDG